MNTMRAESDKHRHDPGLQLDEDLPFQETMWRLERTSWVLMGAIVLGALAGLFGHGPISHATLEVPDTLHPDQPLIVQYDRFARAHSESLFRLSTVAHEESGSVNVWLSGDYLSDVDVGHIMPQPVYEDLASGGVRYHFRLLEGQHTIIFQFRPHRAGRLTGALRLNDGPAASFHQWLYP